MQYKKLHTQIGGEEASQAAAAAAAAHMEVNKINKK